MTPIWEKEITAWLTSLRGLGRAPGTVKLRGRHLRWLASWAERRTPSELTTSDLLEFMGTGTWAPETRNGIKASLNSFFHWYAMKNRSKNPAINLPIIKRGRPNARPAAETSYRAALTVAGPREQLMLRLSATCGLRRAEVAAIHRNHVMENSDGSYTLQVKGKGGHVRYLPLPDTLAAQLRQFSDGFIFPGKRDGHLSPEHVGRLISRLLPDGEHMHMLRHRFATMAYQIDNDLFTVQDLLGHQSPVTTRNYVLVNPEAARRIVDIVAAA